MTLSNYLVLGLIYFICSSTSFTFGIGYFTLYRSVFSGLLTGAVLGNPLSGLLAGAVANLLYIDFTSTGGSLKGDPCLAGIMSAMIAVKLNLMPAASVAAAYPISMLGLILWKYRLTFNSVFIGSMKKAMKKDPVSALRMYNVFLPQAALLVVSVIFGAIASWIVFSVTETMLAILPSLAVALNTTGILLIILSSASSLLWFKYKYNIFLYVGAYLVSVYFHFDPYVILVVILIFTAQKRDTMPYDKYSSSKISKRDIMKSWMLWMNFTHSCYSYEMLQGGAFSHSMVPIMKKLYRGKREEREDGIRRHFEFFNTEPNVGSAIHGYIIQLEDRKLNDKKINEAMISDTKKGLMGALAGMGDFTTQTMIAPVLILGMIYGVVRQETSFFIISAFMMAGAVTYLSLKGFFDGFYYGEEGVIRRVNLPKEIRFYKMSHKIFVILLGLVTGETMYRLISMLGVENASHSSAGLIALFIIFNYMIRKGIDLRIIIFSLYVLNIIFLFFIK
jgi:PTS system mannose-specific IID component